MIPYTPPSSWLDDRNVLNELDQAFVKRHRHLIDGDFPPE